MKQRDTARIVRWLVLALFTVPIIVYASLSFVAVANGWSMRTGAVFYLVFLPLVFATLYLASWFTWFFQTRGQSIPSVIRALMLCLLWIAVVGFVYMLVLRFAFLPIEHEVEFEGEPAVAEVNAFLDVQVTYYGYVGPLFRGRDIIGSEWYGSGGYDPFKMDSLPEPKSRIYRGQTLIPEQPVEPELSQGEVPEAINPEDFEAPRSEEEQAAEALAETEAAFEETGSVYRVTGTVTSQINSRTGSFSFRVDDGAGVLENGRTYQVQETEDVRRLYGMKGLQWGMDGVVIGFAEIPPNSVLYAGVIIGNDNTSSAYWENS